MQKITRIFQPDTPENEAETILDAFHKHVKEVGHRIISETDLPPEKKSQIPTGAANVAFFLATNGDIDLSRVLEEVKHQAETTRANILKPEKGDYNWHEPIIRQAVEEWSPDTF